MPSYDFSCSTCSQVFEKYIPFSGSLFDVSCPAGHKHARRIYRAPQVVFKGSGWYSTDHRKPARQDTSNTLA
jgi:putative FmdB family regulatory protein